MESSFYSSFTIDVLFEMGYFCLSLTLIWCFTNIVYLVYLHCANIFIYITKNQNKVSLSLTFSYLYRGKKIFLEVYMCAFDLVGLVIVCVCALLSLLKSSICLCNSSLSLKLCSYEIHRNSWMQCIQNLKLSAHLQFDTIFEIEDIIDLNISRFTSIKSLKTKSWNL